MRANIGFALDVGFALDDNIKDTQDVWKEGDVYRRLTLRRYI